MRQLHLQKWGKGVHLEHQCTLGGTSSFKTSCTSDETTSHDDAGDTRKQQNGAGQQQTAAGTVDGSVSDSKA